MPSHSCEENFVCNGERSKNRTRETGNLGRLRLVRSKKADLRRNVGCGVCLWGFSYAKTSVAYWKECQGENC